MWKSCPRFTLRQLRDSGAPRARLHFVCFVNFCEHLIWRAVFHFMAEIREPSPNTGPLLVRLREERLNMRTAQVLLSERIANFTPRV